MKTIELDFIKGKPKAKVFKIFPAQPGNLIVKTALCETNGVDEKIYEIYKAEYKLYVEHPDDKSLLFPVAAYRDDMAGNIKYAPLDICDSKGTFESFSFCNYDAYLALQKYKPGEEILDFTEYVKQVKDCCFTTLTLWDI